MRSVRRAALGRRARVAGFAPPSAVTVRSCHLTPTSSALPLSFLLSKVPELRKKIVACLEVFCCFMPRRRTRCMATVYGSIDVLAISRLRS